MACGCAQNTPASTRSLDAIATQRAQYGVPLVGLNVLLQQIGLPIPAVPTMMLAGALAVAGRIDFASAFAISVAASLVADLLWFWAGRRYGYHVLRFLCRISLSPDTCVRQTENIFERWGFFSVVVSKFGPGFATVAPPMAGALRMGVSSFALASAASAALWVGAAMIFGALFAQQIESVRGHSAHERLFDQSLKAFQHWSCVFSPAEIHDLFGGRQTEPSFKSRKLHERRLFLELQQIPRPVKSRL